MGALATKLEPFVRELDLTAESEHFRIKYSLREKPSGRGNASGGVCDAVMIPTILDGLERLYSKLTRPPHSRQGPVVEPQAKKTLVYVLDLAAVGPGYGWPSSDHAIDPPHPPFICLPARTEHPTLDAALQYARVAAIHEATHVFNARERPIGKFSYFLWRWLNEGMAVFLETVLAGGCPDYLQYCLNWVDRPERPLDDPQACYQAAMFVRCLEKTAGEGFVSQLWTQADEEEPPVAALARMLADEKNLVFASASHEDLFGWVYCRDAYFLLDPTSTCFSPEVFARFGGRAVTEAFALGRGGRAAARDRLDHLGCRYYLIRPVGHVSGVEVRLTPRSTKGAGVLKAQLAVAAQDMRRGQTVLLRSQPSSAASEPMPVAAARLDLAAAGPIDHVVLVIANCGDEAGSDGQEYGLTIKAV